MSTICSHVQLKSKINVLPFNDFNCLSKANVELMIPHLKFRATATHSAPLESLLANFICSKIICFALDQFLLFNKGLQVATGLNAERI